MLMGFLFDVIYTSVHLIFRFPVYRARNQLAALDFNHHKDRVQATTANAQPS